MTRIFTRACIAVACLLGYAGEPGQAVSPQPSTATGVIVGVVVDQATAKPIPEATVTITLGAQGATAPTVPQRVMTDPAGRFAFTSLPAAGLTLLAGKAGYVATASLNVNLGDGERITNATMSLTKLAAISGRVTDDLGDPVVGVTVRAHRRGYDGGRASWGYGGGSAQTDDRGIYRIAHLSPGEFVVMVPAQQISVPATVMRDWMSGNASFGSAIGGAMIDVTGMATFSSINGAQRIGNNVLQSPLGTYYPPDVSDPRRGKAYQTTFSPSTPAASSATIVAVQSGDQRTGLDVQLTLVPTVTVSGSVTGPEGPVPFAALRLISPGSAFPDTANFAAASAMSDASGAFTFLNVPAGSYEFRASKRADRTEGLPETYRLWAEDTLTVGETAIDGVRVTLRKPFVVTGRVEFEGISLPSAEEMSRLKGDQALLILQSVDGRPQTTFAREDASGSFTTGPISPGRYIVISTIRSTRWSLKSAMWQGKDLTRTPVDLKEDASGIVATFTDRPGQVTGTVRNAQGAADNGATVLLFPADAKAWAEYGSLPRQMLRVATAPNGTFAFPRVPSGDYWLVAVVEAPAAPEAIDLPGLLRDWLNPAFLSAASRLASRVQVTDGETRTMDLKTTSIR